MKDKKTKSLRYIMLIPAIVLGVIIIIISLAIFKWCFDDAFRIYITEGVYHGQFAVQNHTEFLEIVAEIIALIGAILLLSFVILGILLSKSITTPISYIETKAKDILNGNLNEDIVIETNITEIRSLTDTINKLSSDLRRQDKVRKQMTSDIAHELKTPITNVQSHLEAIIDGVWEPTPVRLESIKEEVERLSQIVLDLRQLCSYDEKSIVLNRTNVDIKSLIESNVESFRIQILEKKLLVTINGENVVANVDRNRIAQAFINLISNAIRYSDIGGKIEISVEKVNNQVQVSVKDEGIGIARQHMPYIFERLYRTDESRARATGGSGIGLTITKSIVEAHGAKIFVNSEANKGSTFTIKGL
ncbi:MAG: sensor histidine kinase [Sarcina sp.]